MNIQFEILSQMIRDKQVNIRSELNPSDECEIGFANSYYAYSLKDGRNIVMIKNDKRGAIESVDDIKYVLLQKNRRRAMKWLCNGQPSLNCKIVYEGI